MINKPIPYLIILVLAASFLLSCTTAPPPDTSAADAEAIAAANMQFMDAFNSGDAAGAATLYTETAEVFPPNGPSAVGRENIQTLFQAFQDAGAGDLQGKDSEISVSGDWAHEVGKFTLTIQPAEGVVLSDSGIYMIIFKRENGAWMRDRLIWNSSVPLPMPEEENEMMEE